MAGNKKDIDMTQEILESNKKLIEINEKLVKINEGWLKVVNDLLAMLEAKKKGEDVK